MSRCKRRLYGLLAVCGLLAGLYLVRGSVLPGLATWLDVGELPRPCDIAIVLGGDPNSRPFVAASLFRLGLVRKVLVIQVERSPETDDGIHQPEHELSREVLLHSGVPPEKIEFLGNENHTTFDEAKAVSALLEALPDTTLAVVTHGYHTRRRWIFGQVLGSRSGQVSFVSVPTDGFCADDWWSNENGFSTIVGENLKLCFYLLRYDRTTQVILSVGGGALVLLLLRRYFASAQKRIADRPFATENQTPIAR